MSTILNNDVSREVAKIVLKAKYPNLAMVEPGDSALVVAAKNIRAELKAAYPGVKFSVRVERFSMGNAIRVGWTDGPNTAQVEAITYKYKAGSFNGMEDIYEYNRSDWKDAFGSAKYITTSRGQSESLVASAIEAVYAKLRGNFERDGIAKPTVEQYKTGSLWRVQLSGLHVCGGESVQDEVSRYLRKLSRSLPANARKHADQQKEQKEEVAEAKPNKRAANYNKSPGRAVRMARAARSAMKRGYF